MQAQGFGRKGAVAGGTFGDAAPRTLGFGAAPEPAPAHDPYAEKRAAFLAQERANGGFALTQPDQPDFAREAQRDGTAAWQMPVSERSWNKSKAVSYLLWLFLGSVAAHRLYLGRYVSAAVQSGFGILMVLTFLGAPRDSSAWGPFLMIFGCWRLLDLFLIPGMCAKRPGGIW